MSDISRSQASMSMQCVIVIKRYMSQPRRKRDTVRQSVVGNNNS
ncbi:MAG: hypothetical protein OEZ39_13620 [Gammaproteobacteria bacterium]|nr:hypothetical protein [Gammaproteobacteria bacterium]MDH5652889.1 hypothetical protein [Gammaproteobacteria bacterium]